MVGGLSIRDVSKSFNRNGEELVALNHVSLDIEAGSFVSVIGPSGCGKSTLLRLIAGLNQADEGELLLDGEPIKGPGCDRGLVFQNPTLFPWLNISNNIAFGLKAGRKHLDKAEIQEKVAANIKLVGLEGFEKSYPHQLSGGMLQRVMIGLAICMQPSLIIADEPTTAIDSISQYAIMQEFLRIKQRGEVSMIFISHDLGVLSLIADRLIVMHDGKAVESGTAQEIFDNATDTYTRHLIKQHRAVMHRFLDALHAPVPGRIPA